MDAFITAAGLVFNVETLVTIFLSAVFGLFRDGSARDTAAARLRVELPRFRWIPCSTAPDSTAAAGSLLI